MLKTTLLTLMLLFTPIVHAASQALIDADDNYRKAVQAKTVKEYTTAFNLFYKLSHQEFGKAQYNLAIMYELGQGTKQNHEKSIYWLTEAVKLHDLDALTLLGELYYHGNGVIKDRKKAAKLIGEAKDRDYPKAVHLWKYYNLDKYN